METIIVGLIALLLFSKSHWIDSWATSGHPQRMTTTVKITADGHMVLPEALRKSRKLTPGTALRVTEAGESILLTPMHPPTEEELTAVIEAAGGPGPAETPRSRKQVEAAIERVRARARKNQGRH